MALSVLVLLAVDLVVTVALGVSWHRSGRVVRMRFRHSVIVTLKTGTAFRGLLFDADGEALILRNAELLGDSSSAPVPVDGEVLIPRHEVEFVQRP